MVSSAWVMRQAARKNPTPARVRCCDLQLVSPCTFVSGSKLKVSLEAAVPCDTGWQHKQISSMRKHLGGPKVHSTHPVVTMEYTNSSRPPSSSSDENTKKNGALVEVATHTAANLRDQAIDLSEAVSGFNLGRREYGSEEEAVAMVGDAIAFAKANGEHALISDVGLLNRGRFVDRDLYLSLYDTKCICRGNGANPRYVGVDGNVFKDNKGKFFVKEIVNHAISNGSGWVEYNHPHPISKEYQPKRAYFERLGNLVISCGVYE